jgi:hypothetical protein
MGVAVMWYRNKEIEGPTNKTICGFTNEYVWFNFGDNY